ncbi:MAG: DoxX family protein [Anaerolineae bacterium]|nr:DoxX family protein [Anaerolineae bacterium]
MNVALWIAQIVLMVVFLAAGIFQIIRSNEELLEYDFMGWVEDMRPGLVKTIGVFEVLGGVGIVVPYVFGFAPILTQMAAEGLALTMVGAAVTHWKRKEYRMVVVNVVLFALAMFVDYGRFLQYDPTLFPG